MGVTIKIPDTEYKERRAKAARLLQARNIDVLIVNSNEADYSNVRYFSGFWPLFEFAAVAIAANGNAALICGPESGSYPKDTGKIERVFYLYEYRETADPSYPEMRMDTFHDVFKWLEIEGEYIKIGVSSKLTTTVTMLEGLKSAYPKAEIIWADDIVTELRQIKSPAEIACIKEGLRIAEIALEKLIEAIKPGITELQLVGIAQQALYENGAESEAFPIYLFGGSATRRAISRATYRLIEKGDIIQIGIGGRVDGYSPSLSCPISVGRISGKKKEIAEFGLLAHQWTIDQLKAGERASDIAKRYVEFFNKNGYVNNYMYGPCHGTGLLEVERPWMETSSEYILQKNMTFEVDTFVATDEFGIRWETGVVIEEGGCSLLSKPHTKIIEID